MMIMLVIPILLILIILGAMLLGWLLSAPVYKGPVSDHFDGRKFHNPGDLKPQGFRELWKWMRNRERGPWIEIKGDMAVDSPAAFVEGDSIVVTFVNHSTFLIQTMGLNILTDPVWSERASPVGFAGPKRMRPPGMRLENLPRIDIILLTHNHYDHLDIRTMKKLAEKHRPVIYCPLGVEKYLSFNGISNFHVMDWWDDMEINQEIRLLCTPAQHFSGRGMFDRDKTLWCGFAVMTKEGSIYYSGDSGYGGFFKDIADKISPIRLAFLPIGAYKPAWFMASIHTSPADALRIHTEIGSPRSIAMHYGTFPLADDGMDEAVRELERIKEAEGIGKDEFVALKEGEIFRMR
jgi:L-ascorbate metabolism protein UlaG (beta-lactamase superfamily)